MMEKEEKKLLDRERINRLLIIYGPLLTAQQQEDLVSYYREDLSLAEIAENRHVSRSAVHLSIKQGEKELEEKENALHILARSKKIYKELSLLDETAGKEERTEILNSIKEELKYGI